jgi:phosphomannomutase
VSKQSRKKKQAIRNIENHLRNYRDYRVGISNLKRKLDMILPNITTDYEIREGSSGVFMVRSTVEDVVICRLESVEAIKTNQIIQQYEMFVETIDKAVGQLDEAPLF